MNPAQTALSCLILAASMACVPALAATEALGAAWGRCTPAAGPADDRLLRVADSAAPGGFAAGPVAAMQKAEDLPKRLESVALGPDTSRPLPAAAQVGNDGRKEQWLRLPESSAIPEPGLWGLLLAGFLGICAVARPRIFSS